MSPSLILTSFFSLGSSSPPLSLPSPCLPPLPLPLLCPLPLSLPLPLPLSPPLPLPLPPPLLLHLPLPPPRQQGSYEDQLSVLQQRSEEERASMNQHHKTIVKVSFSLTSQVQTVIETVPTNNLDAPLSW